MSDLFYSAKRRIARAKEHIRVFETTMDSFFASEPYACVTEIDPQTGYDQLKVKLTRPLPDALTDLAVEAIEALRASLDQAPYATAIAAGHAHPKYACFPIAPDAVQIDRVIAGRCKQIPKDIIAFFRSLEPYEGGNDLIFALNEACNTSKHRLLRPLGTAVGGSAVAQFVVHASGGLLMPRWDSARNELVVASFSSDSDIDYDGSVSFFVVFGDVKVIRGKDAFSTLNAMASEVEGIVSATEAEARRLGIVK
jgi:hypothetical protein